MTERFDFPRPLRWIVPLSVVSVAAVGFALLQTREPIDPLLRLPVDAVPPLRNTPPQPQDVFRYDTEYPAIGYSTTSTADPIARLRSSLARGDIRLEYDEQRGYLDSLLRALGIDTATQVLVFSRTSRQVEGIHPKTPRAIYFNDDTYVAWVQDGRTIEIASMDPQLGPVFHTLNQRADVDPAFHRQLGQCLQCHDSYSLTGGGVPRFITGSGYTGTSGDLVSHEGWILTSDRTPLRSRWGGWYVSGHHGEQVHLGNMIVRDPAELRDLDRLRIGNLADLDSLLDTAAYPSNKSDIVALMVLQHQISVQNAITRVSYDTRMALYEAERSGETAGTAANTSESIPERVASIAEALVEALFLVNEARITSPITGTSGFAAQFQAREPRDQHGRSLRELDLEKRLFRYPLSYVVYSAAFDGLPEESTRYVYRRIAAILRGEDESGNFEHLSAEDRAAIHEILSDTKPEFSAALVR